MYKIPANTLFLGKNLVFVPECHSTNTLAQQSLQNQTTPEGTVIITDNQTAGRGQQGNRWESEPGRNLTFSIILKPGFIEIKDQFLLSIVTSLSISDLLSLKTNKTSRIKWPNDILVDNKKICGTLIENQIQGQRISSSVVGIGLNVNQRSFSSDRATSMLLISGKEYEPESILHELLECFESRYLQLRTGKFAELKNEYLDKMYWRKEVHEFLSDGKKISGTITGIDDSGRLIINSNGHNLNFGIKEIAFVQ